MAHPYTTRDKVVRQARSKERVADLLDGDGDGAEDSFASGATNTAIAEAIDSACELVDARLGKRFTVPFAAITDTPATSALVTRITNFLVLWELYSAQDPDGPDAKYWWARADALMTGILSGELYLDAPERSAETRRGGVRCVAGPLYASGRVLPTDDTSDDGGTDRNHGI